MATWFIAWKSDKSKCFHENPMFSFILTVLRPYRYLGFFYLIMLEQRHHVASTYVKTERLPSVGCKIGGVFYFVLQVQSVKSTLSPLFFFSFYIWSLVYNPDTTNIRFVTMNRIQNLIMCCQSYRLFSGKLWQLIRI